MRGRIPAWLFLMARLTETTYQESIERVDATQGILYGVKVLGENSRNKRKYVAKGMREAAGKYEGVKSYIDHPEREKLSEDRKFSAWSGVFKNPRYVEGKGIFADLHLRQKGEHFEGIIEAAQKFPTAVGFSHVAEGESHLDGETEIVESIREVFSVDLVTDPATTAGFFESTQKPKALREVVEALPEQPLRTKLIEMMDAGFLDGGFNLGGNEKESQPADALTQLTSILRDTIAALASSLQALAKANKPPAPIVTPPAAEKPSTVPGEEDPNAEAEEDDMSPEDKEKIAAFESIQRENAELKASKLLLESGREATEVRMKALANCETDAEQRELLESWPKIEEARRPSRSPALLENATDFPRDNPEKFAALLR